MARIFVAPDDAERREGRLTAPFVEICDVDPDNGPAYLPICSGIPDEACPKAGFGPGMEFNTIDDAVNAADIHLLAHAGRLS
jgi:hypothetical protein